MIQPIFISCAGAQCMNPQKWLIESGIWDVCHEFNFIYCQITPSSQRSYSGNPGISTIMSLIWLGKSHHVIDYWVIPNISSILFELSQQIILSSDHAHLSPCGVMWQWWHLWHLRHLCAMALSPRLASNFVYSKRLGSFGALHSAPWWS